MNADSNALRVVTVGASYSPVCGVRDWAAALDLGLNDIGCSVGSLWWERSDAGAVLPSTFGSLRSWLRKVERRIGDEPPAVVLWHYSVFCYSHRGTPVLAPYVAWCLRGKPVALVAVLHEFAYPWRRRGWRGCVWAATQRAALFPVVLAASGVVVATDERARWLKTRRWLPRRPVLTLPVFATVPPIATTVKNRLGPRTIGVFGYASEGARADLVTGAVALLASRARPVRLVLVGAPGADSPAGTAWMDAAVTSGCADVLEFTGVLPNTDVGGALADLDIVVHAADEGPSARKTTLAACLASGKCVVGFDGAETWEAFRREQIVALVSHRTDDLAEVIDRLLSDDADRESHGRRARAFYQNTMAPDRAARSISCFLAEVAMGRRR